MDDSSYWARSERRATRVLITGTAGKVASHVVRELAGSGRRVRALVHGIEKAPRIGYAACTSERFARDHREAFVQAARGELPLRIADMR